MSRLPALAADWPTPPGVAAFTTLRHGFGWSEAPFAHFNLGTRCGDDPETVARNRDALGALFGLPSAPYWLRQVHGRDVVRLDAAVAQDDGPAAEPEADAAVTAVPGAVLAVLTADCLPVALAARDGRQVGVAHAGWRGLAAGVLEATVAAMGLPGSELQAWLGPAAGPTAYEVGAEVRQAFVDGDADAADCFAATRPGHWHMDLYALARRRLCAAGLAASDIHGGGLCTISDPDRFYSHRRDARTGRMATVVFRL